MMKSSFRIGIDSMFLLEYEDSTEYTVFKKESPSPVEVEPGDLFLLKYGKRKKNQSTTGKERQEGGIAQVSCLFLNPVARFQRVLCTRVTPVPIASSQSRKKVFTSISEQARQKAPVPHGKVRQPLQRQSKGGYSNPTNEFHKAVQTFYKTFLSVVHFHPA